MARIYFIKQRVKTIIRFYLFILIIAFNSCKKEEPISIENTNNPPLISFINPDNFISISVTELLPVDIQAIDIDNNLYKVFLYIDNYLVYEAETAPFHYVVKGLKLGEHSITAKAIDKEGLTATTIITVKVLEPESFEVNIYWSDNTYESQNVEFGIYGYSPNGDITEAAVYINDSLFGTDTSEPFSVTWNNVPAGTYTVKGKMKDETGEFAFSSEKTLIIQKIEPPIVSFEWNDSELLLPGMSDFINVDAYCGPYGYVEKIILYVNDSLLKTEYNSSSLDYWWQNMDPGTYLFRAVAYNKLNDSAVAELELKVAPGFSINSSIVDVIASDEPDMVFALAKFENRLVIFNPLAQEEAEIIDLTDFPASGVYSPQDEKLYMIFSYSGILSVYDKLTSEVYSVEYSADNSGVDIAVDEIHRRIYISTNGPSFILDMDNYNTLNNNAGFSSDKLAIDEQNQWLFTLNAGTGFGKINKYSISDDNPQLIQQAEFDLTDDDKIIISPDKSLIMFSQTNINNNVSEIFFLESQNIWNVKSHFSLQAKLNDFTFNNSGDKIYISGDAWDYVYIYDPVQFSMISEIYVPFAYNINNLTVNSDDSRIVISEQKYYTNATIFYLETE